MNQTDELISNQRRSITSLTKRLTAAMAEIKRLKKVADQAIRILKYKDPELLDEMKEYGDINFSDFADYLKEIENE